MANIRDDKNNEYIQHIANSTVKDVEINGELKKVLYRIRDGGQRIPCNPRRKRRFETRSQTYSLRNERARIDSRQALS